MRFYKECGNIDEVLEALGDPNRVGKGQTWVGKDYSLKQLILDLRKIKEGMKND